MPRAAWIIDKDMMPDTTKTPPCNANAVGVQGPRGSDAKPEELIYKFRMYDDDGELMYAGRSTENNSFRPLDDFGMPNAGCTRIDYYNNGKWEQL